MTFSPLASTKISAMPVAAAASRTPDSWTLPSLRQASASAAKRILADRADHAHLAAGARRGQRLVGALAAWRGAEAAAAHGFAGIGQAVDGGDEVEIDGADDGDQESLPVFAGKLAFVDAAFQRSQR